MRTTEASAEVLMLSLSKHKRISDPPALAAAKA